MVDRYSGSPAGGKMTLTTTRFALLLAAMLPLAAFGQKRTEEMLQDLFGSEFSLSERVANADALAFREFQMSDPESAEQYQTRFLELFGGYGFTVESPPDYEALRAIGWNEEEIYAAEHELNELIEQDDDIVWVRAYWDYEPLDGTACGVYLGIMTETSALLSCSGGGIYGFKYGRYDPSATCWPCKFIVRPIATATPPPPEPE